MPFCFTKQWAIGISVQQPSLLHTVSFFGALGKKSSTYAPFFFSGYRHRDNAARPSAKLIATRAFCTHPKGARRLHYPQQHQSPSPGASLPCRQARHFRATQRQWVSSRESERVFEEDGKYSITQHEARKLVDGYADAPEHHAAINASISTSIDWSHADDLSQPQELPVATEDLKVRAKDTALQLKKALDSNAPATHLWDIYQSLPEPRPLYLKPRLLIRLLTRLQRVEHKSTPGMLRFLALISDMKKAGLGIHLHAWNSALSFAGRCVRRITTKEVESTLLTWRQMEREAGVSSNYVTFNILFDVATKARRFVLAEMILGEMAARKMTYSRYFRTSLIYYYGLRADGDSVRKAYSELVDAGEIVSTTVMNCVISALINCGETSAAELVFERAKQMHEAKTKPTLPPSYWRDRKRLGSELHRATQDLREASEQGESAQVEATKNLEKLRERTSVAPDLVTYRLLINQHAVVIGDIDRTAELVDEMAQYGIVVHGTIFLRIFIAFATHGGVLYTQWSQRRLENTWLAFLDALDADTPYYGEDPTPESEETVFFATNEDIQRQKNLENSHQPQDPGSIISDKINASDGKLQRIKKEILGPEMLDDPNQLLEAESDEPRFSFPEDNPDVYISLSMARQIGLAFAKCTNLRRTAQVWADVKCRWQPEVLDDVSAVEAEIGACFKGKEAQFVESVDLEVEKIWQDWEQ